MKIGVALFRTALSLVLGLKILGWIMRFNDTIDNVLNIAMFSLIGVAYMIVGIKWDNIAIKCIMVASGIFLIGMNFFTPDNLIYQIGIASILIPMVIVRFNIFGKKRAV